MRRFVLLSLVVLVGCASETSPSTGKLESLQAFAKKGQVGYSKDYYLTKNGDDRVALVFGMSDDFSFCSELAEMYMRKYPLDRYSCVPAQ